MRYLSLSLLLLFSGAVYVFAQTSVSSGYRVVNLNGKFGYEDGDQIVIRPQFDFARWVMENMMCGPLSRGTILRRRGETPFFSLATSNKRRQRTRP